MTPDRSPTLFKLFRRKKNEPELEAGIAEAASEPERAAPQATVAVAEPEAERQLVPDVLEELSVAPEVEEEFELEQEPEPEPELEEGPAFDENVVGRTERALGKTRRSIFRRMLGVFERSQIDDELWDELEEIMIGADVGLETTERILDRTRQRVRREGVREPEAVRQLLKDELIALLDSVEQKGQLWGSAGQSERTFSPAVILVVGVNGTGKTTSIAKLARAFRLDGERVILAAGDTFRAAAIEQLKLWGERVGATVIAHQQGQDAPAVVFDAMAAARKRGTDVVIVDTAGRLHTKSNLMEELKKINRVLQRSDPTAPHEVLLVVDAVTGQNGLVQAKTFAEAVGVTGIFLTKMDGTAKGGIVFAIADQLGIPVRFIGLGERADDISPFDPEAFVDVLFSEEEEAADVAG